MAYVGSPFEHDLFVSYSHGVDDGKGRGLLQPWSAAFAEALTNELRVDPRFGPELKLFLDADHRPGQGVDPMAGLTGQLQDQIGVAAILVVLMSPGYLASRWCADERDWWCAKQVELGLSADGRIAVVRIWPTSERWPPVLCDSRGEPLVGFKFHDDDPDAPRPIGWSDRPGEFGSDFRRAIVGIAGRLASKLEWMKERAEALRRLQSEAMKLQSGEGQSIYLHGHKAQQETWERTAIALTESGYAVLPGDPDPPVSDLQAQLDLRERRVDALGSCDALLLLGTPDGRALDVDLVAVGRHDRQSARARSKRLLPCGVLDTVGTPIATAVRKATARNVQVDWLDGTQSPWTPRVRQWLADKGTQAEQLR